MEIKEVEKALGSDLGPVRQLLEQALTHLSNKRTPAPADSAKNSILAVESLCVTIAADGSNTLSKSLRGVERKLGLHRILSNSLDSLYAYANVEPGIRHAGSQRIEVGMDEARFYLVVCSAWVNHLSAKAIEAGIKLESK